MAGVDILSDSTGKSIVAAIKSTDVAQARISEINQAAELKKNEVLASIPEDYRNTVDEVNQIKGDIDELRVKEKWNVAEGCEIITRGFYNPSEQTVGSDMVKNISNSYLTYKVKINGNTLYYFLTERFKDEYSATGYNDKYCARFVCFSDVNDKYISGYSWVKSPITTPSNAKYMYISSATTDGQVCSDTNLGYVWVTEKSEDNHNDLLDLTDDVLVRKEVNQLKNEVEDLKNSCVQQIRKPIISFIFDDGNVTDENLVTLFNSYGWKCGFALTSDMSDDTYSRYLIHQNNGFEILSHSTDGVPMQDGTLDVSVVEAKMKNSLDVLTSKGFVIFGWVTPSTWLNNKYFESLCKYYQYGYGHLDTNNVNYTHTFFGNDVRQLERISLQSNTVDEIKSYIDDCITNKKYCCFYAHAYPSDDNFTVENMTTIMNYIKSYADDGKVIVDIPRNSINSYYSVRHSDLLELYNR